MHTCAADNCTKPAFRKIGGFFWCSFHARTARKLAEQQNARLSNTESTTGRERSTLAESAPAARQGAL